MVMGYHHSEAKGICTQNDCGYLKATNMEEMQLGIVQLLTMQTNRPVVLEVFTQEDTDVEALKAYFSL
jgi:2-succinyl-5-enolpyruvyl-6-hydroxy-3-cyclohexene-1-carboxylate synthase